MKILFTGKGGKSGSWQIRAREVGEALGATVKPHATLEDCQAADVIVVVKRITPQLMANIRASGKPWVYDIVDAYPQPECSTWNREQAIKWARNLLADLKPTGVIWPNQKMGADVDWLGHQATIYHHHRPNIAINPIREKMKTIGYDGAVAYLQGWEAAITEACEEFNCDFVVNPRNLADVDVVLALRGPAHNGYAQQHWKSNVKLANAHGSGTPFIGLPESGYTEMASGGEYWADSAKELITCLNWMESQGGRESMHHLFLKHALPLSKVAKQYQDFLCALKSSAV